MDSTSSLEMKWNIFSFEAFKGTAFPCISLLTQLKVPLLVIHSRVGHHLDGHRVVYRDDRIGRVHHTLSARSC